MAVVHLMKNLEISVGNLCSEQIGLDLSVLNEAAALVHPFLIHHQDLRGKVSGREV